MARIIRIGNSHGIRIPKPTVEQAGLKGRELELKVVEEGVLVRPVRSPRKGWKEAFEEMHAAGQDSVSLKDLGPNRFDAQEWEWA